MSVSSSSSISTDTDKCMFSGLVQLAGTNEEVSLHYGHSCHVTFNRRKEVRDKADRLLMF